MSYFLDFHPKAFKEWKHLNQSIKLQFHKKLKQRLENPRVPKDKLSGYENMYKIKLRNIGYRLAYEVQDEEIVVYVVSVGKRENNKAHKKKAVIMPYEEYEKLIKQSISKESLEEGSFNKFVGILDNEFATDDEKYKAIVK
jgi:mRNA interferase RelE/StbE